VRRGAQAQSPCLPPHEPISKVTLQTKRYGRKALRLWQFNESLSRQRLVHGGHAALANRATQKSNPVPPTDPFQGLPCLPTVCRLRTHSSVRKEADDAADCPAWNAVEPPALLTLPTTRAGRLSRQPPW
jgi:hypothetical protein